VRRIIFLLIVAAPCVAVPVLNRNGISTGDVAIVVVGMFLCGVVYFDLTRKRGQ
jgi:hypothetical protein